MDKNEAEVYFQLSIALWQLIQAFNQHSVNHFIYLTTI